MSYKTFALYLIPAVLLGSFSARTAWDVQNAGDDLNGGGFDTTKVAPSVDRSQNTSPYIIFDGASCSATATTNGTVVTITGCTPAPSSADVGNTLNITGGGGFATGRYQITAQSGNSWTLDRQVTQSGVAGSAMTGRMGGALANLNTAIGIYTAAGGVADMAIYVKSGTYGPYGTINAAVSGGSSYNRISGYRVSHDESPVATGTDRPTIQFNTGAGGNGLGITTTAWLLENLIIDGMGSNTVLIGTSSTASVLFNLTVKNSSAVCINGTGTIQMTRSELTACSGGNGIFEGGASLYAYNWFHDNTNSSQVIQGNNSSPGVLLGNLFTNNTGKGFNGAIGLVVGNTFYRQTGAAINMLTTTMTAMVHNNIFACNGSYGIDFSTQPIQGVGQRIGYNAFHANTMGTIHYLSPSADSIQIGAFGTSCAANGPFTAPVNSGAGDWTPNNIGGAGVLLRAKGFPGILTGLSVAGNRDIGALQHPESGSGTVTQTAFTFVQ